MNEKAEQKREEADQVVNNLDELFPGDEEISTQPAQNEETKSIGGAVSMKVVDDQGEEKDNIEYVRVPGEGSVEAYQLPSGEWAVTRRDKLNHREN